MRILLLSTFVYLIAVAAILYVRPSFMFKADGTWKEFGLEGGAGETSPFPFWLFCITWAIVSFFLSSALVKTFFEGGGRATAMVVAAASKAASTVTVADSDDRLEPLPPPPPPFPPSTAARKKKEKEPKPGYYKLNMAATKKNGVPRYIYLGPEIGDDDASSSSSETD